MMMDYIYFQLYCDVVMDIEEIVDNIDIGDIGDIGDIVCNDLGYYGTFFYYYMELQFMISDILILFNYR